MMYFKFAIIFIIILISVAYLVGYLIEKYDPEKCETCENNKKWSEHCLNCNKINIASKTCFYKKDEEQKQIVNGR